MKSGPFYPQHGLERIVAFHERQERRYQEAVAGLIRETGKPMLVASELAVCDPDNPAVAVVRELGHLCYASAERAVRALDHLWWYARWRRRRNLG
jgi:acetyltransferase